MSGTNIYIPGKEVKSQTFTSNGTFTVPDGTDKVYVEMYGGGGGGASDTTAGSAVTAVRYGGEAGNRVQAMVPVSPGDSISVVIGSGGVGGTSGADGIGGDGTATTFDGLKAAGGKGGGWIGEFNSIVGARANGHGIGRDNYRSSGGNKVLVGSSTIFGGDAGHGNGSDAALTPSAGGRGAGGGASTTSGSGSVGGDGGDGICIVYYVEK